MLPLRVFELEKDAGDGMAGAKFLGSKELTYHPGTSIFSWNIPIQLHPKLGSPPPIYHAYLSDY